MVLPVSDQLALARQRRASGTMSDFDGNRLSLARRLRRMTRTGLANLISVGPAAITQFEKGQSRPTNIVAGELALALGMSIEFFRVGRPIELVPSTGAHFRSLRATPAISRDQALAFAELGLAISGLLERYVDFPNYDVPLQVIDEDPGANDVFEAARATRVLFGIPKGPIPNVVRLIEARGVIVLRMPPEIDYRVDAFSAIGQGRSIVLLSEAKADLARSRFDAAHELGHLVMHPDVEPGSKLIEAQAHGFAAEFLVPEEELVDELPRRLDWGRLQELKAHWGVSLKALATRAHLLGVWGDATYRRSMQTLAAQGYPEPGSLGPSESPYLLGAVANLIESSGIDLDSVAAAGGIPSATLRQIIAAGTENRPRLTLTG